MEHPGVSPIALYHAITRRAGCCRVNSQHANEAIFSGFVDTVHGHKFTALAVTKPEYLCTAVHNQEGNKQK
jgi:hypothetical protein